MFCPKCRQNFEEGSRRFCPTDGTRLVSESTGPTGSPRSGRVFANLIPKIGGLSELELKPIEVPRAEVKAPIPVPEQILSESDEIFFEFDDIKPGTVAEPIPEPVRSPVISALPEPPRPPAPPVFKKVNPYEIPAGHVELDDVDRLPGFVMDFDEDDPERFVGCVVKGRYKVTEYFGGDQSGVAYLADDLIVGDKMVLIRILLGDEDDEIMDSILAEERVSLSHFSHPNIARLIDSGQFNGGPHYLISEFVDALSVGDILDLHGPFSEARAARVIKQIANGLNEAHQEGILHRDIRPENLIIDSFSGEVEQTKLINFGTSNGEPTEQNIGYKAPEVLDGRIETVASDIYSLAVVAYEMVTGQLPFDGSTRKEFVRAQYAGLTLRPTNIRPELPLAVDEVLELALSYNAADRYTKARDFGDAFYSALTESPSESLYSGEIVRDEKDSSISAEPLPIVHSGKDRFEVRTAKPTVTGQPPLEPAWRNRSPEPPQVGHPRLKWILGGATILLLLLFALGWYYIVKHPSEPEVPAASGLVPEGNNNNNSNGRSTIVTNTEMPPQPRDLPQPPNTNFYQNSKQNLKGDLLINFVGFTMYYPKDWKANGPKEGAEPNARGKFLDISRSTDDGRLKEQMLVSYYPSKGTFTSDAEKFPLLVKETNDTLKKLLPGYQMVSEGAIKVNGDWNAYEVKFQGGGTSATGEKLVVWGRRLFIPAARPGVRNGFEITMIATSLADEVRSVDDVGVHGQLAGILNSFEPSQNF